MTGFDSKRQATADKLDDDDAQGYIAQFDDALQKEYQRGYDAGKASQPEQEPVATMKMLHTYGDTTPPERPWVGLTEANMKVLIEQARVVPTQVPCPDYNARLLMLTNAVLKELNT
jgi:hypothetical protein